MNIIEALEIATAFLENERYFYSATNMRAIRARLVGDSTRLSKSERVVLREALRPYIYRKGRQDVISILESLLQYGE